MTTGSVEYRVQSSLLVGIIANGMHSWLLFSSFEWTFWFPRSLIRNSPQKRELCLTGNRLQIFQSSFISAAGIHTELTNHLIGLTFFKTRFTHLPYKVRLSFPSLYWRISLPASRHHSYSSYAACKVGFMFTPNFPTQYKSLSQCIVFFL